MWGLYEELYGCESTATTRKVLELESREIPDFELPKGKPESKYSRNANAIMQDDFTKSVIGDSLPAARKHEQEQEEQLERMFKSGGKAGEKLKKLNRVTSSLPEAMKLMVKSFEEFFSVEDRELLDKAITCLDLQAFFNLFELKVYQS